MIPITSKKYAAEITDKKFYEQHKHLEEAFNVWKGENYQIDDVAILGLKIDAKKPS